MNPAIRSPIVRELIAQMPQYTVSASAEARDVMTPEECAIEEAKDAQEAILFDLRPRTQKQDAARQRNKTKREKSAKLYFTFMASTGNSHGSMLAGVSHGNLMAGLREAIEKKPHSKEVMLRDFFKQWKNITED